MELDPKHIRIAVLGLGYVGLPLAVAFSKKYETIGFDINTEKVFFMSNGVDPTDELEEGALSEALEGQLSITHDPSSLAHANIYIITVPTDINPDKSPNLEPLIKSSELVGQYLKAKDLVIYESTTYPGCTEEVCVPILEKVSGLTFNQDFTVGYSPERINPGDKQRKLTNILKVTSGSTPEAAQRVDALYNTIIEAGTHLAPSIKVAEAAKAIENAQRDVNISFMNELALIFDKLGIDTGDVLEAAGTKWNFLPFKPGLVGGHCISVDPYYLAHKAQQVGHDPEVILSGRKINDGMGLHVAGSVVKLMNQKDLPVKGGKALILGLAFKENTGDVRNSKVIDVYHELKSFGLTVDVHDPLANPAQAERVYGIQLIQELSLSDYQAIILAVAHDAYKGLDIQRSTDLVVYDLKGVLPRQNVDKRL
ncbi:nucleotide sugar dehydrogenase [Schleiferiaceae bacterium]|nr:nucleotide sugar dehydrogenase [Schleiferiaceae bacterium]